MLLLVIMLLIFIIYINTDLKKINSYNKFYYGSAGFIREGMGTLRPQTSYMPGGCYPYKIASHPPTGAEQSRIIFNYWSNKVLSEEIKKTHEELMQQRNNPEPHDVCYH